MRYIKSFNIDGEFEDTPTKNWCKKLNIQNYIIKDNDIVDVNGNVSIREIVFKSIPIQFGVVSGWIYIKMV